MHLTSRSRALLSFSLHREHRVILSRGTTSPRSTSSWTWGRTQTALIKTARSPPRFASSLSRVRRTLSSCNAIPSRSVSSLEFPGVRLLALIVSYPIRRSTCQVFPAYGQLKTGFHACFFPTSVIISISSPHLPQWWLSRFLMNISYPALSISSSPQ